MQVLKAKDMKTYGKFSFITSSLNLQSVAVLLHCQPKTFYNYFNNLLGNTLCIYKQYLHNS